MTVHFVNVALGWAVGRNSLLTTSDGGTSWRSVKSPCPVDRVCFDDAAARMGRDAHRHLPVRVTVARHWSLALAGKDPSAVNGVALDVQCAPDHSAWILFDGLNGATGHDAYIGTGVRRAARADRWCARTSTRRRCPGIDGPGSARGRSASSTCTPWCSSGTRVRSTNR